MKRLFQIILFLLGMPTIIFFCAMSIPVLLYVLPLAVGGDLFSLLDVIWWGIGAFGIWSGIYAAIAYGKPEYALSLRYRIGIGIGIVALLPFMPPAFSGDIESGSMSYIAPLAFLGLIPAIFLLLLSFKKSKNEQECPAKPETDPGSNPKLPIQGPPWDQ